MQRLALRSIGLTLVAVFVVCFGGCASAPSTTYTSTSVAPDGASTVFDGYRLSSADSTKSTLLFIHCWAGEGSMWKNQVDAFSSQRNIIVVDLPGHGRSQMINRPMPTVAALADDVVGVITRDREMHPNERFVLIGHSMGGPIALMVAKQMRQRGVDCIDGVIGVDTLQNAEFTFPKDSIDQLAGQVADNYSTGMDGMISNMLPSDVDPTVKAQIISATNDADHNTAVALLRNFSSIDYKGLFMGAGVPIVCINSVPQGQYGMATTTDINRKYAHFDVILIDGTGHYPQLEKPSVFNQDLSKALGMIAAGK